MSQARSQDFCKGGHDDGGTEGPEGGAKRRSAEGSGSGEGRRSPSPVWGIFEKSTLKLHISVWF